MGALPPNPRRRRPLASRRAWVTRRLPPPAVQGRRAVRGSLVSPGEVVGVGASRWPHSLARQGLATGGLAGSVALSVVAAWYRLRSRSAQLPNSHQAQKKPP